MDRWNEAYYGTMGIDRWNEAYYGTMGIPMHPVRRKFLEDGGLWHVNVALLVRFHDLPRERRIRTRLYWDTHDEAMARSEWTDNSPVEGCTLDPVGCPSCLSTREAMAAAGEDMWCPRRTGLPSREHCFWGRPAYNREEDMCEDCQDMAEEGCGHGDHDCQICIRDNHHPHGVIRACFECGPCMEVHDGDILQHCHVVCPYNIRVVG
jgi:hypothetical protein